MAQTYRNIARVEKTHGKYGEVVVVPTHGLPFLLKEGMRVALVPPQLRQERFFEVCRVVEGSSGARVSFAGVSTLDVASSLVGRVVLAREVDLPEDLVLFDLERLMGREVRDVHLGSLGKIRDAMVGPANDVWVVEGPYGEVLVPVVDEFLVEASREGTIVMELPDGIVDESVLGTASSLSSTEETSTEGRIAYTMGEGA